MFLLGHSMGSYIAQAYLLHHSASLQGRSSAAPTSSRWRCIASPG
jgi:alpha-beta hydrolase superfamily lysophospholipase